MSLLKIKEAEGYLNTLFTTCPDSVDALVMYGHCKFISNQKEAALESYYRAMRVANMASKPLTDNLVHQRIGAILISQKKWKDAKVMFEFCANSQETAFSFMNLGVACLYLDDYDAAEAVLAKANILDTQNANVWGYMTLAMLNNGNRVFNAF